MPRTLWYWQPPITWVPWWDDHNQRWIIIAESGGRGVFYIWLTESHQRDQHYAERTAAALTRVYAVPLCEKWRCYYPSECAREKACVYSGTVRARYAP